MKHIPDYLFINFFFFQEAFGSKSHCLGILLVKNLPKTYAEKRARLLRLASVYASLPDEIKEKTVHGKEILNGKKVRYTETNLACATF